MYLGKKCMYLVVPHGYGPHEASAVIPSSAVTVHTCLWQEVQVGEEKGKEKRKEKGKGKGNKKEKEKYKEKVLVIPY